MNRAETTQRRGGRGLQPAAAPLEIDAGDASYVDEDDRTVSKSILLVSFFQIALTSFFYTVVIPTSRQYAESLDAPDNFQAYMVGAAALGGAFMNPVYRWLLSKSFAGTMHFQLVCMQVGSLLYALAQVADKIELLIVGRLVGGCGSSVYPIYQYIAEEVGKNHRSEVISMISGFGKSFGFALGPIFAACLAYVDFNIGKLEVDKETNPGWTVAILCLLQTILVVWVFPRHGSRLIGKPKAEPDLPQTSAPVTLKERMLHLGCIGFLVANIAVANAFISAWQLAATNVVQLKFQWSIQWSAVLVGGVSFTPAFVSPALGRLTRSKPNIFQDRGIVLWTAALQLCTSALLFDYGASTLAAVAYIVGGLLVFNCFTVLVMFSLSLATKISTVTEVDKTMSVIGLTTILRALGFVLGTYLSMNALAATFAAGSLAMLICTLLLHSRLKPM